LSLRQSFQLLCDSQSHPGGRLSLPRRYHLAKKTGRRRNVTEARGPTVHEKRFERAGSTRSGSSDSCWERQDCANSGRCGWARRYIKLTCSALEQGFETRKLAAILAVDIVGFSRLTGRRGGPHACEPASCY